MPNPISAHPITLPNGEVHRLTVHLDQVVSHPNIEIGAFTYASAFVEPEDWAGILAPYLIPGARQKIRIGRYCQIADGVKILSAANHALDGFTTYPFPIFDLETIMTYQPDRRDTLIGNDVWLGNGAIILPGATIGDGVIVGAGSVVRGIVPDYSVVIGNPANVTKMRFDAATVTRLKALAWWNWPDALVAKARPSLLSGDLEALEALAP
jgi:virginiamycin A acetyltransferase